MYVGKYRLKDGWEFAITLEGTQLFSQGAGQQKFPIFAESETKFFLKGIDAKFEFVRDTNGNVTTAILHQGETGQERESDRQLGHRTCFRRGEFRMDGLTDF